MRVASLSLFSAKTLRCLVLTAAMLLPWGAASLASAESGAHRTPPPPPSITEVALADAH